MFFFDVDTQRDFMESSGALYVPGAESIKSNIERLLRYAGAHNITVISSRCAHGPDDEEFAMFPPHCLDGSRGAERIFANLPELPRMEISVDGKSDASISSSSGGFHYEVKKKIFNIFSNPWLSDQASAGVFRNKECIVFGVATDYCVRDCVSGLIDAGAKVVIVEDAIRGVAEHTTSETLNDMRRKGVIFTTTQIILTKE